MKRKTQDKINKDPELNMMEPLQLDKLGTVDDVCFGKHHDLTADECSVCGDAEICSIVCAQKLHSKRKELEEQKEFKDIEKIDLTWKELSKTLKRILKKYKTLPISKLKDKVIKKLHIHESLFDTLLKKVLQKNKKYVLRNNSISYGRN